jgi:hypothetical protein
MIKLKKTKSVEWLGVAMGSNNAEWVVVGFENIAVRKLGINWFAVDTSEYAIFNGRKVNKKIAKADTKAALLDILANKLQAAA